jgi:hypothetical protein
MKIHRLLSAGLVWLLVGCQSTGFSALQSVNPVMLGPVASLGRSPAPQGETVGAFDSRTRDFADAYAYILRFGKTTTVSAGAASTTTSPNQPDYDVLVATSGDPNRRVIAKDVTCGGYNFFFLVAYAAESWCNGSGYVAAPPSAASVKRAALDPP